MGFYVSIYFGHKTFGLPLERLLGLSEKEGLAFLIYVFLYILLFWGLSTIFAKRRLVNFEDWALSHLDKKLCSTRIINRRNEIDSLKANIIHGPEGVKIRNTTIVKTLLFLMDHCLVTETSERVIEIFSRRMETLQKHVESSYNMLRYIAWAIPSLGFIGTVMGIGAALANTGEALHNITIVTRPLGMAFDTTLIALIESVVLMFFIYNMQHKEEKLLNSIDLFCQERFILNLRLE